MISDSGLHSWRDPQRIVNTASRSISARSSAVMRVAKRQVSTIRSAQSIMMAKRPFCPFHARMPVMSEAHRQFLLGGPPTLPTTTVLDRFHSSFYHPS